MDLAEYIRMSICEKGVVVFSCFVLVILNACLTSYAQLHMAGTQVGDSIFTNHDASARLLDNIGSVHRRDKIHVDLPGQHGNQSPHPVIHRDIGNVRQTGKIHVDLPGQHGNQSPHPVIHRDIGNVHQTGKIHIDLPGQHGYQSPHPVIHRDIGNVHQRGKIHVDLPGQHGNQSPHPVIHRDFGNVNQMNKDVDLQNENDINSSIHVIQRQTTTLKSGVQDPVYEFGLPEGHVHRVELAGRYRNPSQPDVHINERMDFPHVGSESRAGETARDLGFIDPGDIILNSIEGSYVEMQGQVSVHRTLGQHRRADHTSPTFGLPQYRSMLPDTRSRFSTGVFIPGDRREFPGSFLPFQPFRDARFWYFFPSFFRPPMHVLPPGLFRSSPFLPHMFLA